MSLYRYLSFSRDFSKNFPADAKSVVSGFLKLQRTIDSGTLEKGIMTALFSLPFDGVSPRREVKKRRRKSMSTENEKLVTEFCLSLQGADMGKVVAYLSEDVVYHNIPWQ